MNATNTEKVVERSFAGVEQLSLRSLILGAVGSCIITASSMYVALKISALPWPTIFVAVLSMALLKALGKTTLNEINITQTSMSSGAMVAGGLAFTLPGLWFNGEWTGPDAFQENFWKVLAITIAGMLLGTVLTWYWRIRFVDKDALPYPIGTAAAETLTAGDAGGSKSVVLFTSMGLSAVFTYLRDGLGWIPSAITFQWLNAHNFDVGIWVSPMAAGIGYMIGTLYTGMWFLGAVLSYLIIVPLGPAIGLFPSATEAADFKNTVGIGLMVGTGIGILISFVYDVIMKAMDSRRAVAPYSSDDSAHDTAMLQDSTQSKVYSAFRKTGTKGQIYTIVAVGFAFVFSIVSGLGPVASVLLILGTFVASAMSATITGQTGINPMEIFGIIILLAIRLIVPIGSTEAFFIAACVAVACGYAGDMLNDYKTGKMLGTNPTAQLISQFVGGLSGSIVAAVAMFAVINQFGGVGQDYGLPAGQAFVVSQMVNGIGNPMVFATAVIIGALLYLLKVPTATLGLGMYLPFNISSVVFLGGLIRFISDRVRPKSVETGTVAASGMLGGEGITGVTLAIISMITGS